MYDVNKINSICVGRQASVHICCGSGSHTSIPGYICRAQLNKVCHAVYPWFDTHGGVTRDSRYSGEGFTRADEGKQLFGTQPVARHDQRTMQGRQLTPDLIAFDVRRPPPFSNGHGSSRPLLNCGGRLTSNAGPNCLPCMVRWP